LVVLSGGQDSTTALFMAKSRFEEVHAITFDYDQRHRREIDAALLVGRLAGVKSHEVVHIGPLLKGRSPLTNPAERLETYSDYATMQGIIGSRVELTFVPMRNALFLVLAANRAACLAADGPLDVTLVAGVCEADGANYPDCRSCFIAEAETMINTALGTSVFDDVDGQGVDIWAPLISKTKAESILMAIGIPGCYVALAYSHTAYGNEYPPTGKDHASVLRAHGFEAANIPDPLVVRAYYEGQMELPDTRNYNSVWRSIIDECGDSESRAPVVDSLDLLAQRIRRLANNGRNGQ
jgi:7-cyano-7-deazaguanine synthase